MLVLLTELSRGGGVESGISSMYSKLLDRFITDWLGCTQLSGDPYQKGKAPLICGSDFNEEVVKYLSGCDFRKLCMYISADLESSWERSLLNAKPIVICGDCNNNRLLSTWHVNFMTNIRPNLFTLHL